MLSKGVPTSWPPPPTAPGILYGGQRRLLEGPAKAAHTMGSALLLLLPVPPERVSSKWRIFSTTSIIIIIIVIFIMITLLPSYYYCHHRTLHTILCTYVPTPPHQCVSRKGLVHAGLVSTNFPDAFYRLVTVRVVYALLLLYYYHQHRAAFCKTAAATMG